MIQETEFMRQLLPEHYTCEPRVNGVHCQSNKGIDEDDKEQWYYTFEAIRQKFGWRFQEVFHYTCNNHNRFMVYIDGK